MQRFITRDPESTTLQPLSAPREAQGNKGHSQPPGASVPAATQKNSRRTPFTVTLPQDLPPPSSAQPPALAPKHQAQDASAPPRLPGGSRGCSCWAGGIPGELGGGDAGSSGSTEDVSRRPALHNSDHIGRIPTPRRDASPAPGPGFCQEASRRKQTHLSPRYPLSLFTSSDALLPSLPPPFYCRPYTSAFAWTIATPTTHFLYCPNQTSLLPRA